MLCGQREVALSAAPGCARVSSSACTCDLEGMGEAVTRGVRGPVGDAVEPGVDGAAVASRQERAEHRDTEGGAELAGDVVERGGNSSLGTAKQPDRPQCTPGNG